MDNAQRIDSIGEAPNWVARGNTEVMEDHTEGTESVLDALYEILMPNALRRTFGPGRACHQLRRDLSR